MPFIIKDLLPFLWKNSSFMVFKMVTNAIVAIAIPNSYQPTRLSVTSLAQVMGINVVAVHGE